MMGTNYILCSVGSKPNQNKNEQTTPHPNPKKAARRNAGSPTEYTDSKGTVWHSWLGCAFNSATYLWLHLVFMTRQGPRNSQATKYSPPQYNFPFLHFLSRIRVFFLHERSAVHDGWESLILGARTLISRPLKPLSVQNTVWRQAWRQPWRGCVQTEGGETNHPKFIFSQTRGETKGWHDLRRVPQLGDDGGGPPWQNQVVSTCWPLPRGFSQVLVLVLTETRDGLRERKTVQVRAYTSTQGDPLVRGSERLPATFAGSIGLAAQHNSNCWKTGWWWFVCPQDLGSKREGKPNSTARDNYNEDALVRDNHKNDGSRKTQGPGVFVGANWYGGCWWVRLMDSEGWRSHTGWKDFVVCSQHKSASTFWENMLKFKTAF